MAIEGIHHEYDVIVETLIVRFRRSSPSANVSIPLSGTDL